MANLLSIPNKIVKLNQAQLYLALAKQPIKQWIGGRGSGKSTAAGYEIKQVIEQMPRSANFICGETYQSMLTRTLPSTIAALADLGYYQNYHYFVGKQAPKKWNWPVPFEPVLKYDYAIHFFTGATYVLLSQDVNSRGINLQSGLCDEFALLDYPKFESEVMATLRGQKHRFSHIEKYLNMLFLTSLPRTRSGEFVYKWEEEARNDPSRVFCLRSSSFVNKENLPEQWFENARRSMTRMEYQIEIQNIQPDQLAGSFYPFLLLDKHTYTSFDNDYLRGISGDEGYNPEAYKVLTCRQDSEIISSEPLDIGMDYGSSINCIVTGQMGRKNNYRILSGLSVTHPYLVKHLMEEWCRYYEPHSNKTVYYYYDHTAIAKTGLTDTTYHDTVQSILRSKGWIVVPKYIGQTPSPEKRYNFWGLLLKEDNPNLPTISFNRTHCSWLLKSMANATTRQRTRLFEKDKRDEQNTSIDQRTTTHLSDAGDTLVYGKFSGNLSSHTSSHVPVSIPA